MFSLGMGFIFLLTGIVVSITLYLIQLETGNRDSAFWFALGISLTQIAGGATIIAHFLDKVQRRFNEKET